MHIIPINCRNDMVTNILHLLKKRIKINTIMTPQTLMTHSEEQIALACQALRMSFETVKTLFGNREVKDISTSGKKRKNTQVRGAVRKFDAYLYVQSRQYL